MQCLMLTSLTLRCRVAACTGRDGRELTEGSGDDGERMGQIL